VLSAKDLATDRRLIERAQRDRRRFVQIYERYVDRVYAFALTRTRDRELAQDVTQETFRIAFEHLPQFEWRGVPLSGWLFRIALREAIDAQKVAARTKQLDELPDESPDSWEALFIEVEERVDLFDLIKGLPRDQRRVIELRFGQGRRVKDIALVVGRTEGAVKQLQFRALASLRVRLGRMK